MPTMTARSEDRCDTGIHQPERNQNLVQEAVAAEQHHPRIGTHDVVEPVRDGDGDKQDDPPCAAAAREHHRDRVAEHEADDRHDEGKAERRRDDREVKRRRQEFDEIGEGERAVFIDAAGKQHRGRPDEAGAIDKQRGGNTSHQNCASRRGLRTQCAARQGSSVGLDSSTSVDRIGHSIPRRDPASGRPRDAAPCARKSPDLGGRRHAPLLP